ISHPPSSTSFPYTTLFRSESGMSMIEKVSKWIELFGQKVTQNKETLNKLDTAIGDGDHGSNLTRGAAAIQEKAEETTYDNLSKLDRKSTRLNSSHVSISYA